MKGRALSVRQPWASLIVAGLKSVELRTWSTQYRGPLLIHASKTVDAAAMEYMPIAEPVLGALIGRVVLVRIEPLLPSRWAELAPEHMQRGPCPPGLYAWHLERAEPLSTPIPCRGDLGLFDVECEPSLLPMTSKR